MEGKCWDNIWKKIAIIALFICVIFSHGGLFNLEIAADSSYRSTRGSEELEWIQTTQEDFENGSISQTEINGTPYSLEITTIGEIKLSSESKNVWDHFNDESKIAYQENLIVDTSSGVAKLIINLNKTYGGSNNEVSYSIKQTPDGGYILVGEIGIPSSYIWLIKTDNTGKVIWNRTFTALYGAYARTVELTSDGGYIIGGIYTPPAPGEDGDFWVIKTDDMGNIQWNNTYGGAEEDQCYSLNKTSDGGYILTGSTNSYGSGFSDVWLVKINNSGEELWNKTFGGSNHDHGNSVKQTSDGGYIIVGVTEPSPTEFIDIYIIKTNSTGDLEWENTFGGDKPDGGYSVLQTDSGYVIAGSKRNPGDFGWLIKTDNNGNELWNKTYAISNDCAFFSMKRISDGNFIMVGSANQDLWMLKTDENGNEQWNKTYGGSESDYALDVQETSDGGFIVCGATYSYGAGGRDIWLIKTDSVGNMLSSTGELTSTNLLQGHEVSLIDEFDCEVFIPSETGIKLQFSQDNINWYNSSGNQNGWDILSNGINHIYLSPLAWSQGYFYYRMNFTSNSADVPTLEYIKGSYSRYLSSGIFHSQLFDSNTYPSWKYLNWSAQIPLETELKFQLRTGDTEGVMEATIFIGPDGSSATYYTSSGQSIYLGHERDRWLQYKVSFFSTNLSVTPLLEEVKITYIPIDTDKDDIPDFEDLDDDNDEMPDTWEVEYNFDPLNNFDAPLDPDFDGLSNVQEFFNFSNPHKDDSDGDNLGDGFEVIFSKTKPNDWDTNNNSIGDGLEFIESRGYLGWVKSLPDNWIGITLSWENYTVYIKTNSSVLEGEFDKVEQKLKIKVSGPEGTSGVTELDVPKTLCELDDIEIKLDGELINYTITENDTYYFIHIEYNHSAHELTADFTRIIDEPIESEDKDGGLPVQYFIILVVVIILTILILLGITRIRNGFRNNEIPDLPPQELSKILEEKYAEGEMTDKTYNDIKSLLEKYEDAGDDHLK